MSEKKQTSTLENWDYQNFEVLSRKGSVTDLRCKQCWAYNLVDLRHRKPVETKSECKDGELRTFSLFVKCNHCDNVEHLEQEAPAEE